MKEKKRQYNNKLPKGCELCITGEKSVLFITGICPRHCFYCPISDQKYQKDVIYINEWKTDNFKNIITEIKLCKSKGVGITGGDPLARIDRACQFIKMLKKTFGKSFHIHLYTSLNLFTKTNLTKLYKSGLDEIRCHPDLDDNKLWSNMKTGTEFSWDFGMEIPIIPNKEKQTEQLINFAKEYVQFINLNELEYSDTNAMKMQDYKTKNNESYGIKGSEKLAKKLLKKYKKLNIHYCTASFKDNIQMRERIKKRAESIKKQYEKLTEEGTILRGTIYLKELNPKLTYSEMQNIIKNNDLMPKLQKAKNLIKDHFSIIKIDKNKLRILCPINELKKKKSIIKQLKLVPAIVEEYPTHDAMEVEIDFL
ncbi:radical SAM protein [Candidatus Woesearchaeota archaeon CG10_big_fil_rev_8_21_14_0_10_34_8]|nr:MAG: radical SAM protein [Candidatus Woesearchaeota archaeon CG10_big_fil_rev_8_21_14_0_10_34_8]